MFFKHFETGKQYVYLGRAKSDLGEQVVYMDENGGHFVRPVDEFFGTVDVDGVIVQRFTKTHGKAP